ncbi:MAG: hypoxanthine phosphoribosyltransferase [Pseudomonadota bacterium]
MDKEILFTREEIQKRIIELGQEISGDYKHSDLVAIGVLSGAFIFMADLIRALTISVQVDFVRMASYGSKTEPDGELRFTKDIEIPLGKKHVLIVEDIVDTGATLMYLEEAIKLHSPLSIKVCALINKTERRRNAVEIDYAGFAVDSGFVVGYGLDYNERYRHFSDLYRLRA